MGVRFKKSAGFKDSDCFSRGSSSGEELAIERR